MSHSLTNRKDRIQAIRSPGTAQSVLKQIFEMDKDKTVIRALIDREDVSESLLDEIYEWTAETRESKFGPISEGSGKESRFFPNDPKKQYDAYQIRYSCLISFAYRKSIPQRVAEKIALDERHDQGAAMLAANGILSEEFILKILDEEPRLRPYFYVFPRNNSVAVRAKLIDYLKESQDYESFESFKVCQVPTPEEAKILKEIFPSRYSTMSEEEKSARFDERLEEINEAYRELFEKFYFDDPATFLLSRISEYDRIFTFDIDALDCHDDEWSKIIETYPEGFRAEYLLFSKKITLAQMKEAARDDYYLPCFYLGNRPDLNPDVAEILFNDDEPFMRFVAARNMATPQEIAEKALLDSDPIVRLGFALRSEMSASALLKVLKDPARVVAEAPFNEQGMLPLGWNARLKLTSGSPHEYLSIVQTASTQLLLPLAYLLGRTEDQNTVLANDFLGSHPDANVRVEFIRGQRNRDFLTSMSKEVIVKLAGDKLSQIRKYVLQHSFSRDIQQADFARLFDDPKTSEMQKMVLAAAVTDRKVWRKMSAHTSELVKLGAFLNWKLDASESLSVSFTDPDMSRLALQLALERDQVGEKVNRSGYMGYSGEYEDLSSEELDLYWGGQYPTAWGKREEDE